MPPSHSGEQAALGDGRSPGRRWTEQEHAQLEGLVRKYGDTNSWTLIARFMTNRTGKQCRQRWVNTNRSGEQKKGWDAEEEEQIATLHSIHGPAWSSIARLLHGGRTENQVKNHWNTLMRSKFLHTRTDSVLATYILLLRDGNPPNHATLEQAKHKVEMAKADDPPPRPVKHNARNKRASAATTGSASTSSDSSESSPTDAPEPHKHSPASSVGPLNQLSTSPSPTLHQQATPQVADAWPSANSASPAPTGRVAVDEAVAEMRHMAAAAAALLLEEDEQELAGLLPVVAAVEELRQVTSAPAEMAAKLEVLTASLPANFHENGHHIPHHHAPGRSATWQPQDFHTRAPAVRAPQPALSAQDPLSMGVSLARQRALHRLHHGAVRSDASFFGGLPNDTHHAIAAVPAPQPAASQTAADMCAHTWQAAVPPHQQMLLPGAHNPTLQPLGEAPSVHSLMSEQLALGGWAGVGMGVVRQQQHIEPGKRRYEEMATASADSPTSEGSTTSKRMHFMVSDVMGAEGQLQQLLGGLGMVGVLGTAGPSYPASVAPQTQTQIPCAAMAGGGLPGAQVVGSWGVHVLHPTTGDLLSWAPHMAC